MAEAIAGISSAQRRGIGLYHVVNPHWDDNVSLDSFLGWIEGCGYPLKRIPDYNTSGQPTCLPQPQASTSKTIDKSTEAQT